MGGGDVSTSCNAREGRYENVTDQSKSAGSPEHEDEGKGTYANEKTWVSHAKGEAGNTAKTNARGGRDVAELDP
jgi:hypothetical protein